MDLKTDPPLWAKTIIRRTSSGGGVGGVILGKYELGNLLGRGSFAKVYQGRNLFDDTSVAIKVIEKSVYVDAAMEPRIISEVSAMRRLHHHPNILKLHEVMATKTKIYLVMELAEGGELSSKFFRRGGGLPEPTARRYFQQLISALHFCHCHGVAHRDIKPQNLLLDSDGNIKVSDFGLSALPEQLKNGLLHTACGTPAFTAPEVFHRTGYDGSKADAWSCGVILYIFLAGCLPFHDSNLRNMYLKMHRREFKFPDKISKHVRSVIYRLLDPNPSTRLTIEALVNLNWFKKSLENEMQFGFRFGWPAANNDKKSDYMVKMNAFDIISMSSGLDLSGLFEGGLSKNKERRFTSRAEGKQIEEKLEKVGRELGYRVERVKGGGIGLAKGKMVLEVEILEVAEQVLFVELKVVDAGTEAEEFPWEDMKTGLGDIVHFWHDRS